MRKFIRSFSPHRYKQFALLLAVLLGTSVSAYAQTDYYVKSGSSGSGTSFADAFGDLESALSVATSGDKIYIAAGTYLPSQQYNFATGATSTGEPRNASFRIPSGVEVYGGFTGNETGTIDQAVLDARDFEVNTTILSGDFNGDDNVTGFGSTLTFAGNAENAYHVVYTRAVSTSTIVDGITIQGGFANSALNIGGAAWYNDGSDGIGDSSPTVRNCVITKSSSSINSAAMHNDGSGTGGSVSPTITNTTFSKLSSLALYNNGANAGSSVVTIENCVFWGISDTGIFNFARVGGGTSTATVTNCTFANNGGVGLAGNRDGPGTANFTVRNSIFWNNTVASWNNNASFVNVANTLIQETSASLPVGTVDNGGNIFNQDPVLACETIGDLRINAGSPAIDAGNNASVTASVDRDGNARIQNTTVDMGAFEYGGAALVLPEIDFTAGTTNFGNTPTGGNNTLTYTINNTSTTRLIVSSITSDNGDFAIQNAPNMVAENSSATFDVVFSPSATGAASANITINSDDCDESVITFGVTGTGVIVNEYYVKSGSSGTGASFADAFGDLESALSVATAGDKIYIAAGTYKPTQQYDFATGATATGDTRAASFRIPDGVELYGGFTGNESGTIDQAVLDARDFEVNPTVLSGDFNDDDNVTGLGLALTFNGNAENAYHVVYTRAVSSTTIVDGVTIKGGNANGSLGLGGAWYNDGSNGIGDSSPTVRNCVITESTASLRGGGMHNNSALSGSVTPTIINTTFSKNFRTAMYNAGGGGGNSVVTVENCVFWGNDGAVFNHARVDGALANATITNCTFADNTYGVAGNRDGGGTCNITINNSVFWNNGDSWSNNASVTTATNTLIEEATFPVGTTDGGGNILNNQNPVFACQTIGDLRIDNGSPAINAGDNALVNTTTDRDGNARIQNTTVDMGAFEYGGSALVLPEIDFAAGTTDFGNTPTGGSNTITYTINNTSTTRLIISSITSDEGLFVVQNAPSVVAGNSSATFDVVFSPVVDGAASANITINSDDCDESVITFGVTGTGVTGNTVAITTAEPSPTMSPSFGITITFSTAVTGFELSDMTVANGTVSNLNTSDNTVFTATLEPASTGEVTVDIAANVVNEDNLAGSQFSILYDGGPGGEPTPDGIDPTVVISSSESDPTNSNPFQVTFTWSEEVVDFIESDIVVGNGSVEAASLSTADNIVFTANIIPASDGLVTVDLPVAAADDLVGNDSEAADQFSVTYDGTAPTVAISSSEADPSNSASFEVTITFSEEVSGFVAGDITVGNGSAGNLQTSDNIVFTADITPAADGTVTVDVLAAVANDAAGNGNEAATQFSITYDATAPTVAITTLDNPTNASPFEVTITFSEEVSGFIAGDITVGNGTAGNLQTSDNIVFTADITPTAEGAVTVDVLAGVADDLAGNGNEAATQLSVDYDTTSPTVAITSAEPDPTNASPFAVTITFSEEVSGFVAGDITVGNGSAGNLQTSDNITFTADITPATDGTVTVDVAAGVANDLAGNGNEAATQFSIDFDGTAPTVAISSSEADPTNSASFEVTITFSEEVSGFAVGDITVGNGSAGNLQTSNNITFTADITPAADGAVTVDVLAGVANDAAGNGNEAATQFSITSDTEAPTGYSVTIDQSPIDIVNATAVSFTFAGAEVGATYDYSFTSSGGGTPVSATGAGPITSADQTITGFDLSGLGDGTITLTVSLTDVAGNQGADVTDTETKTSVITWSGTAWAPRVPLATDDVVFAGDYDYPADGPNPLDVVDATINVGVTVTQASGTISVAGDLTNNGTFTQTDGTIAFDGTAAQTVTGGSFLNVEIASSATVSLTGAASVDGVLTLTSGTLASGGNLTLTSTQTQTAFVSYTAGSITGDVTVERFMTDNSARTWTNYAGQGYRYISSPINNLQVGGIDGFTENISEANTYNTSGAGSLTAANFPNIFTYDESRLTAGEQDFTKGWEVPTATTDVLANGQGFIINIATGATVSVTGALNTGDVTTNVTRGSFLQSGWVLLGNPYVSPLNLTSFAQDGSNSGITGAAYLRIASKQYGGVWGSYIIGVDISSPSNIVAENSIAPMQSFMMRTASVGSSTVTFKNAHRSSQAFEFLRTSAPHQGMARLKVTADDKSDELVVYFHEQATEEFDMALDAERIAYSTQGYPSFFTEAGKKMLQINGIPADFSKRIVQPLRLWAEFEGEHTIELSELADLDEEVSLYLEDRFTGQFIDLRSQPAYSFTAGKGFQTDRFFLHTGKPTTNVDTALEEAGIQLYAHSNILEFRTLGLDIKAEISVYDLSGRSVIQLQAERSESIATDVPTGIYIVRVITAEGTFSKRVMLE